MGALAELLEAFGLAAAPAAVTSAEARNVLRYPTGQTPTVLSGTLVHTTGGLSTDAELRPRVCAILGPEATLRGVAETVLPLYNVTGGPAAPTLTQLAQALYSYSGGYLTSSAAMDQWQAGLQLPLPIEIDTTTGHWIVNSDTIRGWAGSPAATAALLDQPAAWLDQPSGVTHQAEQFILAQNSIAAVGTALYAQVMTNPFASVFLAFGVISQLENDQLEGILAFMDAIVDHEAALLGTLTAGAGVLRRIRDLINTAEAIGLTGAQLTDATRADGILAAALTSTSAGVTIAVPARELPQTAAQVADQGPVPNGPVAATSDPDGGVHRLVLGRDVTVGHLINDSAAPTYYGPSFAGRIDPVAWISANTPLVNASGDPVAEARLAVIEAIAPNEGWLDAIRARDRGILSSGLQQWSVHAPKELASLLYRFKQSNPDEFDLYFAMYGLDVEPDQHDANACLWDLTHADGSRETKLTGDHDSDYNRLYRFFGGTHAADHTHQFDPTWSARLREASIASDGYKTTEAKQAIARFDRILSEVPTVTVNHVALPLPSVMSSQKCAALVLDSHINKPNAVQASLNHAAQGVTVTDPQLREDKIRIAFECHRNVIDRDFRNATIDNANLDEHVGSFSGWAALAP